MSVKESKQEGERTGNDARWCLAVIWIVHLPWPYIVGKRFNFETYHEALKWLLTIDERPTRLASEILRLSEFKLGIVYSAIVRRQAAGDMSRIPTDWRDKVEVDDKHPVLVKTKDVTCTNEPKEEPEAWEIFDETTEKVLSMSLSEVYAVDDQVGKTKTDITALRGFSEAQVADSDGYQAVPSVGKPSSTTIYDIDIVLVRILLMHSTSIQFMPTVLSSRILGPYRYSRFAGHPGERLIYHTVRSHFY